MTTQSWFLKDCNAFLPERGFRPRTGIRIRNGRIAAVGTDLKVPRGATVFDAQGAWTTPGLIDAHTHMGLKDHLFSESDVNEKSDPVTPFAQVTDAINPLNDVFPQALRNGVTTVMVLPGSTNVFGGLGALIKTYGRIIDSMILRAPAAMKMALGANPKNAYGSRGNSPATRMGNAYIMRKVFRQALEYRQRRKRKAQNRPDTDIGLENVLQVLDGRLPARIHCHRADDIMTALRIADEFGFHCCLDHVTEGYLIADELVRRKTSCFVGPSLIPPAKQENARKGFANVARLRRAGVRIAIITDHGVEPCWYLAVFAGIAVREGLPEEDALQAITSWPAEMMGIRRRVGRLAGGLDADIAVWDRHPLFMGKPVQVFAAGEPVIGESRDHPADENR